MKRRFEEAPTFLEFLDTIDESLPPWRVFFERARVENEIIEKAGKLEEDWHLLALCEGWCGDGANVLPYLAKLAEAVPNLHLRVLSRDENADLMDEHLTNGNRSIPVVMILDGNFREVAWWGPRPAPLQEYFEKEIRPLPMEDRYPRLRAWYARDRGRTTLQEILDRIPELGRT